MKIQAEELLEGAVRKAKEHYYRDRLWDKLRDMTNPNFRSDDLNQLLE
jgi:hypothetical protein